MEQSFRIKTYGYAELAQYYMPTVTKKSASVQFRRWILKNKDLQENLKKSGFIPGQRILTPLQVRIIIAHFGEP